MFQSKNEKISVFEVVAIQNISLSENTRVFLLLQYSLFFEEVEKLILMLPTVIHLRNRKPEKLNSHRSKSTTISTSYKREYRLYNHLGFSVSAVCYTHVLYNLGKFRTVRRIVPKGTEKNRVRAV